MERVLYIHVGPAKTGTSALQAALRAHDNSVVVYPKVGLWADGSHHNLVLNFFRDYSRPETRPEDIDTLFGHIAEEARQTRGNLVISSEVLAGRPRAAAFVDALLSRLGPGFRAEFVFVVRDHFERAASLYNQRVKDAVTCERRDPDEFLTQQARGLAYAQAIGRLKRTPFGLRVLSYHPSSDFAPRALRHFGFSQTAIPEAPFRNISLSTKALVAALAANRTGKTPADRDRIVAALRSMPNSFGPSQFIFGLSASRDADRQFALDREYLRDAFGIDIPAPDFARKVSAFAINEQDYAEIAEATSSLNSEGAEVRARALQYLRPMDDARRQL